MNQERPSRPVPPPVSRREELALAEAQDLPDRADGIDRRDAIAKRLEAERELDPRRGDR